jgi:hypothetical protein
MLCLYTFSLLSLLQTLLARQHRRPPGRTRTAAASRCLATPVAYGQSFLAYPKHIFNQAACYQKSWVKRTHDVTCYITSAQHVHLRIISGLSSSLPLLYPCHASSNGKSPFGHKRCFPRKVSQCSIPASMLCCVLHVAYRMMYIAVAPML